MGKQTNSRQINFCILFFCICLTFFCLLFTSLLVTMKKHFFNLHLKLTFYQTVIVDHSKCLCFTFPNPLPFSRLRTWWRRSGRVGLECRALSTPCSRHDLQTTRSDPSKPESTSLVKYFNKIITVSILQTLHFFSYHKLAFKFKNYKHFKNQLKKIFG